MQYNGSQTVLDIRDDLGATMNECREVTEKYRTGRSAYLRIGQLFMKLFAGLLYCIMRQICNLSFCHKKPYLNDIE